MGSLLMHIGISEKIRKRLNLSTKFTYGSILPDLVKMETGDRTGTHFLKTIVTKDGRQRLPVINNAITMLNGRMDKEIRLGYIAHLIEDLIWFDKYIPSCVVNIESGRIIYLRDNSVHLEEEFIKDIYDDYTKINAYIIDKYSKDYNKLKEELAKYMTKNEQAFLDKCDKIVELEATSTTRVITKECLDKYIEESIEKVEKIVKELIGE